MKRGFNKGQMKLSFGMIFSIILIIFFITFAFYGISKFLEIQDAAQIGQFTDNLQSDVDRMWRDNQGSKEVEYFLPSKIKAICFENEEYNLNFVSDEFIDDVKINHLDLAESIGTKENICFDNLDGKIKFTIKKNFGENLVIIER